MYDVIIIGSGVIGAFISMELSKYDLKTLVLEKEEDLVNGVTKGNSGIVHSGYSPKPKTLKARLNLEASRNFEQICEKLDIPYKKVGSILVAIDKEGEDSIYDKYKRGIENGVSGLKILSRDEVLNLEPNLNPNLTLGLYSENTGVVDNFKLNIRPCQLAAKNGVEFKFNEKVIGIEKEEDFLIKTNRNTYRSKILINSAGLFVDDVDDLIGRKSFNIKPKKGQYYILDKDTDIKVNHVIFLAKNKDQKELKGMIVSPTTSGNIIIGPSTHKTEDKEDYKTSIEGLKKIERLSRYLVPKIKIEDTIRTFGALRPKLEVSDGVEDFIIEEDKLFKNYIRLGGIKSPGLTCAPSIGKLVKDMVLDRISSAKLKDKYIDRLDGYPRRGRIICRCENITEGEIIDSINDVLGANNLEAVKKRLRASMGTCQGGFCTSKILEVLERELGQDINNML